MEIKDVMLYDTVNGFTLHFISTSDEELIIKRGDNVNLQLKSSNSSNNNINIMGVVNKITMTYDIVINNQIINAINEIKQIELIHKGGKRKTTRKTSKNKKSKKVKSRKMRKMRK